MNMTAEFSEHSGAGHTKDAGAGYMQHTSSRKKAFLRRHNEWRTSS